MSIQTNEDWIEFQEGCAYHREQPQHCHIKHLCIFGSSMNTRSSTCAEFYCQRIKKEVKEYKTDTKIIL